MDLPALVGLLHTLSEIFFSILILSFLQTELVVPVTMTLLQRQLCMCFRETVGTNVEADILLAYVDRNLLEKNAAAIESVFHKTSKRTKVKKASLYVSQWKISWVSETDVRRDYVVITSLCNYVNCLGLSTSSTIYCFSC